MSSSLLFLTSEDFNIQHGTNGNIMCNSIADFSLVLFYSTHCAHCKGLIPIFKNLPGTIGGCQFAMVNISNNRMCVDMSKNSITPITYVPLIILYINGKPFMIYKGAYEANEIRKFIIDVAANVQKKQQFTKEKTAPNENGVLTYGAKPLCGDDKVCYLEFQTAYKT